MTKSDKEHVTSYFYKNSKKFNLINLKNKYDQSKIDLTVDNVENFLRLKSIVKNNKEIFSVKSNSLNEKISQKMTKDLFNLLTKGQKTLFILLLFSYLPIILLETLSIGSIPVFVLMILNPEQIFEYINNIHLKKLILDSTDQERALYGLILVASLFIVKAAVVLSVNYFEISLQKKNGRRKFKKII